MPVDMKEVIAEAAKKLLFEKKVKKLTVKNIVEECNITRQAFYYHFNDIPELLEWGLEHHFDEMLEECLAQESVEDSMKYFITFLINILPYVENGALTSYWNEVEELLYRFSYNFLLEAALRIGIYDQYDSDSSDKEFLLRYHCSAILGLIRRWTKEDTENVDNISHRICQILKRSL